MIRKFLRMLFHLKARERLDIAPRMYAAEYDPRVSPEVAQVFARSAARSPENIKRLLKQYEVETIEELVPLLPTRQRRARPRERFYFWMMRMRGLLPYDPLRPTLRRMIERGNIPEEGTLIYRSRYPYEAPNSSRKGGDQDA